MRIFFSLMIAYADPGEVWSHRLRCRVDLLFPGNIDRSDLVCEIFPFLCCCAHFVWHVEIYR